MAGAVRLRGLVLPEGSVARSSRLCRGKAASVTNTSRVGEATADRRWPPLTAPSAPATEPWTCSAGLPSTRPMSPIRPTHSACPPTMRVCMAGALPGSGWCVGAVQPGGAAADAVRGPSAAMQAQVLRRHARVAHRAEHDGLLAADLVDGVRRHHGAGLLVTVATPIVLRPAEAEAVPPADRFEDLKRRRHHLAADPVAGQHRHVVNPHALVAPVRGSLCSRRLDGLSRMALPSFDAIR